MKKEKSWTRFGYERAYRSMRRGCEIDDIADGTGIELEILKAADYSYQAWGYVDTGWLSNERRKHFYQILWRTLTGSEGIPF
jgi:hypothetical protein